MFNITNLKSEAGHAVALFAAAFVATLGSTLVATGGAVDVKVLEAAVVGAVVAGVHAVVVKFAPVTRVIPPAPVVVAPVTPKT
jgi:hypothetical protein